ncbi:hypothetical protein [Novosphingobium sp. Gsoil 351]|uniref:hypothetical protein n=1 Tax=Novosphingobium sp. Gsoil 351 TaxID=2675225 RepID=UPI0012B4F575|nr:hypothetical protein [Novosphingobium sp. Gsoil 351]QGN55505.1 hypothetical protein GKE62_14025 [Novosphingobium sp. Gsoil 351]
MSDTHNDVIETLRQQQVDAIEGQSKAAMSALAEWQKGVAAFVASAAPAGKTPEGLPEPQSMLTDYFRFAEQVLASQYEFALALLKPQSAGSGAGRS